ncbi:uncharacterized protein LOC122396156 [Colletes gigas]|uniref:uncharacterized protein LOC122396156 n=1 Tax=Colletes gigas TaxID=935657 RepID=UPI001C9AE8DE|nr:uncharacterized protein LOC122396156 [Colletes gigas]
MTNIEAKIKIWIELIKAEKLDAVTKDIQTNISPILKENINKHIFKLLLYLSHTADKCDKQNYIMGNEIHKLTCLLCSILSEIPDSHKFVSSLFHIIRCLLALCMYKEASEVCSHLETEALCHSQDDVSDILVKIAYLWYIAVNNAFLILQNDSSNRKHYYKLKDVIRQELEIIQVTHKNYTKHLLMKISSYLEKIASINEEPNTYFTDFCTFVIDYLNRINIFLNRDEKYNIFRYMLHILSRITCENINKKCLESELYELAIKGLNTLTNYFKTVLREDTECYQCIQQFQSLYLALLKPVERLVETNAKSIQDLCDNYGIIAKQYGYKGSIKWMTFSIIQVLESLFIYWSTCITIGKKTFLENGMLLKTMNLITCVTTCFLKEESYKCKICLDNNCTLRRDMYNVVVIKTKCINVINKLSEKDLSKDICRLARKFLEQNVAHIFEMKQCKCKSWTFLWSTCGSLIYNLGIMSECIYKESVSLICLLFTSIIKLEGVQPRSEHIKLENPTSVALHRLCLLHYNHDMYREAMTASALNGLLSYNNSNTKAFSMWAKIKHKSITSEEIIEITMLACLKADREKIEELGLSIELSQYDLVEICLREVKGLQEAKVNLSVAIRKVLDDMTTLKVTPMQYARGVQMLVYHLLNFDYDKDSLDCLRRAISDLKKLRTSSSVLCLQANLEFYVFVTQLYIMNKKTETEMENTKFALCAPKLSEIGENESRSIVPAYTMINIKEDSRLQTYLQAPLNKWNKCLKQNIEEIAKSCEPSITLHTLIIAGEYAHLYRYQECEVNIWTLAYKLALDLQDNRAIIYITGRSISLRHINYKWITIAKKLAVELKDTNDEDVQYAIAIFWISLSDFYFESSIYDEAKSLLDESRKLSGISFLSNTAVYLYSLDRILYNCYLYKEDVTHEEYTRYIVETLYSMVSLNEDLSAKKWKPHDKRLFCYDILISATVNLSLRMNSLLSFQEIVAHLVHRLKTSQALGATIRVAEILKSLCYIDLLRSQLNDCEVKLQGLEHILNIETFKASMKSNLTKSVSRNILLTPIRAVDPIRDVPQNDTSPVLRDKVFDLPEFFGHTDCNCYACQNVSYHYLIFASTHIRAQLYALQQNFSISLQHFHGAFKIKDVMKAFTLKDKNKYLSWQERFYSTDYVLLLINFSYFLRSYSNRTQDEVVNVARLANRVCNAYKLIGHPIYMSVNELILDEHFQRIFDSTEYSMFTVPDTSDINISKYVQVSKVEESTCITPIVNNTRSKKPISLRRIRTPPLLKLTKVSINFSDDEDNSSPPSRHRRTRLRGKLTRRKLLDDKYSDDTDKTEVETKESEKRSSSEELIEIKKDVNNVSMKDILNKIVSLVPDVSEYVYKAVDNVDEPATSENVQNLIERIEDLKINGTSHKDVRKTRHKKQLTTSDCTKINQVIALFKDLDVNEQQENEKNSVERSGESSCIGQYNKTDNLKKPSASESTRRSTRLSTKNSVTSKKTHNTKIRKP